MKISILELLANNAETFWGAARRSSEELSSAFDEMVYNPSIISNLTVATTNISFAIELYFKAIAIITTQKSEFGHDLQKLYKKLPCEAQDHILSIYHRALKEYKSDLPSVILVVQSEQTNNDHIKDAQTNELDLNLLLQRHKETFTRWRYMHEIKADPLLFADFPRLECLFMAARNTFQSLAIKYGHKFHAIK